MLGGIIDRTPVLVLSVSKDALHTPMPWFDKLTTGAALVGAAQPRSGMH